MGALASEVGRTALHPQILEDIRMAYRLGLEVVTPIFVDTECNPTIRERAKPSQTGIATVTLVHHMIQQSFIFEPTSLPGEGRGAHAGHAIYSA